MYFTQKTRHVAHKFLEDFLELNTNIDLTIQNEAYFDSVFFYSHTEALKVLLNHQENYINRLEIKDEYTIRKARFKFCKTLQSVANRYSTTKEMDILLEKYVQQESDSDSDCDLQIYRNLPFEKINLIKPQQD